ncbi:MAG: hypothetical protein AAF728_04645 [Cyanobacteria bacterium P01_D01_bin.128]
MGRRIWAMLIIGVGVYLCLGVPQQPIFSRSASAPEVMTSPSTPPAQQVRLLPQSGTYPFGSPVTAQTQVPTAARDKPSDSSPENEVGLPDGPAQLAAARQLATRASQQALSARTAEDWDQVALGWLEAIAYLQAIPPGEPQRVYAQRALTNYQRSLAIAQAQTQRLGYPTVFPPLGSPILDQQLIGYLSYVAAVGVPDVLLVGSSRVLWGIDAQALETALANNGYRGLRVYNFGVNGATAQVVNWMVQQLLTPEQLPKLILWADGSRAFNSARRDATHESIVQSSGYQSLGRGDRPSFSLPSTSQLLPNPAPLVNLDSHGFLPKTERFNPATYYQQFPRVLGRYDNTYVPFRLEGRQTEALTELASYLQSRSISLVFINLPLTDDYQDETRGPVEARFQSYLQQQSAAKGFGLVDYLNQWRSRYGYFADPSHLNRFGAEVLARQLAAENRIPWAILDSER